MNPKRRLFNPVIRRVLVTSSSDSPNCNPLHGFLAYELQFLLVLVPQAVSHRNVARHKIIETKDPWIEREVSPDASCSQQIVDMHIFVLFSPKSVKLVTVSNDDLTGFFAGEDLEASPIPIQFDQALDRCGGWR